MVIKIRYSKLNNTCLAAVLIIVMLLAEGVYLQSSADENPNQIATDSPPVGINPVIPNYNPMIHNYVEDHRQSHAPIIRVYKDFNAWWGENRDHATLLSMGKIPTDDYFIHPMSALSTGIPPETAVVLITSNSFGWSSTRDAQNASAAQANLTSFVKAGGVLIVDMADNDSSGGYRAPGAIGTPSYVFPSPCADATLAPAASGPDGLLGTADDHPIVKGPDRIAGTADDLNNFNIDMGSSCHVAHGNLVDGITLPNNATVLMTATFGGIQKPILAEYGYESGIVILDSITKEFFGHQPVGTGPTYFMRNLFTYALRPTTVSVASKFDTVDLNSVFTISVNAKNSKNLAGVEFDLSFNPNVLEVMNVAEGNFLKGNDGNGNTNFISPKIDNSKGLISGVVNVRMSPGGVEGNGTLAKIKFIAKGKGNSALTLQNVILSDPSAVEIPHIPENSEVTINPFLAWDVNQDNSVNMLDFVIVGQNFGKKEGEVGFNPRADVNRDGQVDIFDLILLVQHFRETIVPAAPAIALENLTPEQIAALEKIYQIMDKMPNSDPEFLRIKAMLRELILLSPNQITHTRVLQNYPNPFNPETWIPFELAAEAKVTITIYNALGQLVRTIDLGEKLRGSYASKEAAAYWDGKNEYGESVAGGVYFYRLQAGKFSAVKKMILIK